MTSRPRLSAVLLVVLATMSAVACSTDARGAPTTATSATTTSSTAPASTTTASTTTTVAGPSLAQANAAIAAWAKTREGVTEISIGNLTAGTVTDLTGPQVPLRIASVMKTSIAIQFLRLRHAQNRAITAEEIVQLGRMIEVSDNGAADDLWDDSGKENGLGATTTAAKMTQTAYQPGHGWGFSLTTAHDQALLATALAKGQMLDETDTRLLLGLMRNVQPDQRWGFADVVDPALAPAVKNGWYEDTDDPVWRVHCTAIFDNALLEHPFTIAVMTKFPAKLHMSYGQDTCRGVAHLLGPWLTRK